MNNYFKFCPVAELVALCARYMGIPMTSDIEKLKASQRKF